MKVRLWLIVYIMSSGEQRDIRSAAETLYRNAQQPYAGPSRYGLYWIFFLRCLIKWYSVQDLNFKLYLLSVVNQFYNVLHFLSRSSSKSQCSFRFIEFCSRGLYSWLHTGWPNVNSSAIFLFVRYIWSVFHFNVVVYLHYGE